jgi:pSer/pThr/pTyr-binding forkhead associated (FHA) protein
MDNNKLGQGPQVRLVGLTDPYKGQVFVIDKEDFIIGRTSICDLSMSHSTISGRHAKIQKVGDHYEIMDLQSTNGTYLNGIKIERKHLRSEDKVKFDQFEFQFIDPADVGRTMISRPAPDEIAKTMARDRAPLAAASHHPALAAVKKGSPLAGVIVGLLVSFLIGLVGNAVMIYFSTQQSSFSVQNFGSLLKDIALRYPAPHIPQVWFKQNWSDWRTIVSLGLIVLAIVVGGILVQAIGKRARAASAFVFSLFYVIVAVLIQLIIVKFQIRFVAGLYPQVVRGLSTWPDFALAFGLFFAVVFVLSFVGTLFAKKR